MLADAASATPHGGSEKDDAHSWALVLSRTSSRWKKQTNFFDSPIRHAVSEISIHSMPSQIAVAKPAKMVFSEQQVHFIRSGSTTLVAPNHSAEKPAEPVSSTSSRNIIRFSRPTAEGLFRHNEKRSPFNSNCSNSVPKLLSLFIYFFSV